MQGDRLVSTEETNSAEQKRYRVARKFYESLTVSERLPPQRVAAYQESQLQQMLAHTAANVPFYREALERIRLGDGRFDLTRWHELPIVSRDVVRSNWLAFQSFFLPPGHRSVIETSTSGSEAAPLRMRKTRFEHTGVACASYRYAKWFGYDYSIPLAMIRAGFIKSADPDDPEDALWGPPWISAQTRGARQRLDIRTALEEQLDWLCGLGRVYLNTLPSNAMALAQLSARTGKRPELAAILTVGERLTEDVRAEVTRHLGCRMSDVYATAECGLIANECPETGHYHVQSEISKVETVTADGVPCGPGMTGQLVATSLYNFAMPIIRYRFNDLIISGTDCACGRSLPVITKILGLERGLFRFADGTTLLPEFRTDRFVSLAGTPFWQVAQRSATHVEVRLKDSRIMQESERTAVGDYVRHVLGKDVDVTVNMVEEFSRSQGGKFYPVVREF
jgi:phenylacetate-CoA ligase